MSFPRSFWRFTVGGLLLAASAASSGAAMEPAPSEAMKCLTPPKELRGMPAYPIAALKRRESGRVSIRLTFDAPDAAPQVKLLNGEDEPVSDSFVDAVERFVSRFRVPCLAAGAAPAHLLQEYVFTPNESRKVVSWVGDVEEGGGKSCAVKKTDMAMPEYPTWARRDDIEGAVLAQFRFTGVDTPPEVTIDFSIDPRLSASVKAFAATLRLPCLGGEPAVRRFEFYFRLNGSTRPILKDLTLMQFLRASYLPDQPVFFSLDSMGCPFDLSVMYRRPHWSNRIGELGASNPARRPFLQWLSDIQLKLDARTQDAVVGEEFTLQVPCGTIDL